MSIINLFFPPALAQTATSNVGNILPACAVDGNCSLCDFIIGFVNIANFLLATVGSVALLFFIYGGFVWLTAGGNESRVKHGSAVLVNTVIGILVVFGAWLAINFTVSSLTNQHKVSLFNGTEAWYNYCTASLPCIGEDIGNGDSCGNNLVCKDGACITECAYKNPIANSNSSAASCFVSQVSGYTCTQVDCPNEQWCCLPNAN